MHGQVLFMQPLPTKLVELDLAREILTHNVLDALADRRLERVLVDLVEVVGGICTSSGAG